MPRHSSHTPAHQLLIATWGFALARTKLAEARTLRGTALFLPTVRYAVVLHKQALSRRIRALRRLNGSRAA